MPGLSDFILKTRFEILPEPIVAEAIRCLTDTLGVAVAASETSLSRIIRDHAAEQFGGKAARLWQDGRFVSAAGAALANGMTIDALDAHDGHKLTKGHVGCGVIPAALALSEADETCNGREFLTRVVIGYEIGTRAGIALHASACDYHTSGAWVALATAAIGARRLGLSSEQAREALGIAEYHGPRSQMMRCIDHPTMVKDGSGWGAMAGVSASCLARDGFTGAPAISTEAPDLAEIWGDIGQTWRITEQYIKLYPVCRWAQPAVEAVLALARDHQVTADAVEGVTVESFHEAKCLNAIPDTAEQAQYSLPFSVAAALVRGTIGVAEVSKSGLCDVGIMQLARSVTTQETDAFNDAFPARRFARVHLQMKDGRTLTSDVTEAKGDPENRVSNTVISEKFHSLVAPILGSERTRLLEETIQALPDAASPSALADAMASA